MVESEVDLSQKIRFRSEKLLVALCSSSGALPQLPGNEAFVAFECCWVCNLP